MGRVPLDRRVVLRRALLLLAVILGAASRMASRSAAADPKPGAGAATAAATGGKTVRLFTVGNSFSGNATRFLPSLVKAGGHTLVLRTASVGGAPLSLHWGKAEAHEKDPQDPAGLYASKKGLAEELRADKWDFVTIQQASIKSHDLGTYRPYARNLHDFIQTNAPGAQVLVHQTWAYRVDDKRFAPPPKGSKPATGEPASREEMYKSLTHAYRIIAAELGSKVVPVGDAFQLADSDPAWGYRPDPAFDPKAAQPPALPDQSRSLHVGWKWSTGKGGEPSLQMDGHHASDAGQYLGACVFYEVLFGESVVENTFMPKGLDADYARFLRQTAHRAVEASRQEAEGTRSP